MARKDNSEPSLRINARETDAFDIVNIHHYIGPNPYLNCEALTFDFALTGEPAPLAIDELRRQIADKLPELAHAAEEEDHLDDYGTLIARTISVTGQLRMGLHMDHWAIHPHREFDRIAIQCLHKGTLWDVVFFVWDWLEAINLDEPFHFEEQLAELQGKFSDSVYGGPSTYALLRAAYKRHIPTAYLWDEGLVQYGYGSRQVRGAATTFDRDSQLDSDFTCRKDDCKNFLGEYGFPVPSGDVVDTLEGALAAADEIEYPVVLKPLDGHKGIGVTANVLNPGELDFAFQKAGQSGRSGPGPVIVEKYVYGDDYRLLCVAGEFAAAVKRQPPSVIGDGRSTIAELIDDENARPERADTPTSALGKIPVDDVLDNFLKEQRLSRDSIPDADEKIVLRKVANLSSGGVSENVTDQLHPDNVALCRTISQHFNLTCMGIDVLTDDISRSWKEGNFGIIEINAAPGIFMHLNPAVGNPVDVPSKIIETFFDNGDDACIPIITFNHLSRVECRRILDIILASDLTINPGGVCREAVFMRRDEWPLMPDYNSNVRNLLRNTRLDMLIAEAPEPIYTEEGIYYDNSDLVILEEPDDLELTLAQSVREDGVVMIRRGLDVTIIRDDQEEHYQLAMEDEFKSLYLREIKALIE